MPVAAVSMRVSAERITYFARQNLLEHGWREALEIVRDSPGLSTDQAIQLFKGEKHFIDDPSTPGTILFVDDPDSSEWREELGEAYGSICKIGSGYYKPYGYVADYGPEDLGEEWKEREHLSNEQFKALHKKAYITDTVQQMLEEHPFAFPGITVESMCERARHYALDASDKLVHCALPIYGKGPVTPMWVLYEEADEPPFWHELKSPEAAALDAVEELDVRGYQRDYGSFDLATERDIEAMTRQARYNFAKSMLKQGGAYREASDKLDQFLESTRSNEPHHYDERRKRILDQNDSKDYGYRLVDFGADIGVRSVPNGPLRHWALRRGATMDSAPEWDPISMSGLKQAGDDPVHTDWITGAGLEEHNFSVPPLSTLQYDLARLIQKEELGFDVHVLVAGKTGAFGTIKHCTKNSEVDSGTIAVVANASIHFDRIAREAAAVIVMEGGALSHLAVNGLSMGQLIIRDPEARKNYPEGMVVSIDATRGIVSKVADPELEENSAFKP